jgi:hypothetical protein
MNLRRASLSVSRWATTQSLRGIVQERCPSADRSGQNWLPAPSEQTCGMCRFLGRGSPQSLDRLYESLRTSFSMGKRDSIFQPNPRIAMTKLAPRTFSTLPAPYLTKMRHILLINRVSSRVASENVRDAQFYDQIRDLGRIGIDFP